MDKKNVQALQIFEKELSEDDLGQLSPSQVVSSVEMVSREQTKQDLKQSRQQISISEPVSQQDEGAIQIMSGSDGGIPDGPNIEDNSITNSKIEKSTIPLRFGERQQFLSESSSSCRGTHNQEEPKIFLGALSSAGASERSLQQVQKSLTIESNKPPLNEAGSRQSSFKSAQKSKPQSSSSKKLNKKQASYFGSSSTAQSDQAPEISDSLSDYEIMKLRRARVYCYGLEFFNMIFIAVDAIRQYEDESEPQVIELWVDFGAWAFILFALIKSHFSSMNWVIPATIVLAFRNVIPLLELQTSNSIFRKEIYMLTTVIATTFLMTFRLKHKELLSFVIMLIWNIGIIKEVMEQVSSIGELALFVFTVGTSLIIYFMFISDITRAPFDEEGAQCNSEMEIILDNLEMGIVLVDSQKQNLNYFNEYSQDKFSRALTLRQRFSIGAVDESTYFNKICSLEIFQEYKSIKQAQQQQEQQAAAPNEEGGAQPKKVSLLDILNLSQEERDSKVFTLMLYDSKIGEKSGQSEPRSLSPFSEEKEEHVEQQDGLETLIQNQHVTSTVQFLQIKKKSYIVKNEEKVLIQLVDISKSILYEQEHAKSELFSQINLSVSREMRQPLSSILSLNNQVEVLLKDCSKFVKALRDQEQRVAGPGLAHHDNLWNEVMNLEQKQKEHVSEITSQVKKQLFFINDIIDFGKIRSHSFEAMTSSFDVREAIQEVVALQEPYAKRKGIEIDIDLKNFEEDNFEIEADGQRLKQVLMNLLSNAIKFSTGGQVQIRSKLCFDQSWSCWRLVFSILDTGMGMTKMDQTKLFRLGGVLTSTRESGSVGLGLVISNLIVSQLKGRIQVFSRKGKGSLFTFDIMIAPTFNPSRQLQEEAEPFCYSPDSDQEDQIKSDSEKSFIEQDYSKTEKSFNDLSSERLQLFTDSMRRKHRILVVDDFQFNIDALTILLKVAGIDPEAQVHRAMNGAEAVKQVMYQKHGLHYTLIFMDCNMPVVDGYQATARIRQVCRQKKTPQPKIFAVTGNSEEQYKTQALNSGMDGVFSKPVQLNNIMNVIRQNNPEKVHRTNIDEHISRRVSRYQRSRKQSILNNRQQNQ